MAAIATATPIQIDPVNGSGFTAGNLIEGVPAISGEDAGPWKAPNGALYVLLYTPGSPGGLNIFKSTNGGSSWTQMGTGPTYGTAFANSGSFNSTFNQTTGVLTIGFGLATSSNTLSFATYATATDTWTATAFPNLTDVYQGPYLAARADGSLVCVYQQVSGGAGGAAGYRICTAGTWGSFQTLEATGGAWGAYLDGNQTTHCIVDNGGSPARTFLDFPLSSSNVIGSGATILLESALAPATLYRGTVFGSQILIPVVTNTGALNTLYVYSGTPLTVPVYTSSGALQSAAWSASQAITNARIRVFGTTAYLLANYMPTGTTQVLQFTNSGSGWSGSAVFYDAIANPPNAYTPQSIGSVSLLIGSVFGLVGVIGPSGGGALVAYFLFGATTPVLTIRFGGIKVYPS